MIKNKDYFKKIDSEEKAYWLGFLYADGCVYIRNKTYRVILELSQKDIEQILKFKNAIGCDNKIYTSEKYAKLDIGCKEIVQDLINLGCIPNKSLKLTFPTEQQVPKYLINHFIRGYFDGDGCISYSTGERKRPELKKQRSEGYTYKQYTFKLVGTKEFLEGVVDALNLPKNKLLQNNNKNNYDLKYGGKPRVTNILNLLYENSNIYLKRKRDIFENIILNKM